MTSTPASPRRPVLGTVLLVAGLVATALVAVLAVRADDLQVVLGGVILTRSLLLALGLPVAVALAVTGWVLRRRPGPPGPVETGLLVGVGVWMVAFPLLGALARTASTDFFERMSRSPVTPVALVVVALATAVVIRQARRASPGAVPDDGSTSTSPASPDPTRLRRARLATTLVAVEVAAVVGVAIVAGITANGTNLLFRADDRCVVTLHEITTSSPDELVIATGHDAPVTVVRTRAAHSLGWASYPLQNGRITLTTTDGEVHVEVRDEDEPFEIVLPCDAGLSG